MYLSFFLLLQIGQCQVLLDGRHGTAGRVHAGNAAAEWVARPRWKGGENQQQTVFSMFFLGYGGYDYGATLWLS